MESAAQHQGSVRQCAECGRDVIGAMAKLRCKTCYARWAYHNLKGTKERVAVKNARWVEQNREHVRKREVERAKANPVYRERWKRRDKKLAYETHMRYMARQREQITDLYIKRSRQVGGIAEDHRALELARKILKLSRMNRERQKGK
jgi:hypothetical protein